jgi:hypothetical protein
VAVGRALYWEFSRRQDRLAREDGPAALAGAVTRVRDGGDRLAAGAGERRCGGGPRRASPTLRQRAWAAAYQRRDSPAAPSCLRREPSPVQRFPSVALRRCPEPGQGRTARRAEGVPFKDVEKVLTGKARQGKARQGKARLALCQVIFDESVPADA